MHFKPKDLRPATLIYFKNSLIAFMNSFSCQLNSSSLSWYLVDWFQHASEYQSDSIIRLSNIDGGMVKTLS